MFAETADRVWLPTVCFFGLWYFPLRDEAPTKPSLWNRCNASSRSAAPIALTRANGRWKQHGRSVLVEVAKDGRWAEFQRASCSSWRRQLHHIRPVAVGQTLHFPSEPDVSGDILSARLVHIREDDAHPAYRT